MAAHDSTTNAPAAVLNPLSSVLTYLFRPGFVDLLDASLGDGLWTRLPKVRASGADIRQKFHWGRNTGGGATTETGTIGTPMPQRYVTGRLPFHIYTKPIAVTDFFQAQSIAAGHSGYEAWADEMARAAEDMRQDLEKDLWTAQTGNAMLGVPDYVDDGSNTNSIWGLDRDDYPMLKAIRVHNSGTDRDLTFALLRQARRQVMYGTGADIAGGVATFYAEDQGGAEVSIWATTPILEQHYEALLVANKRYPIPRQGAQTGVDPALTDMAYSNAPVVASKYCASGKMYGLDLRYWSIEILPQHLILPTGERMETDFALIIEGRSGQSVTAFWRIYCQLVNRVPHKNVQVSDLDESAEPSGT